MVTQYPDIIVVSWNAEGIQDPTTGNIPAGVSQSHTFQCRAETNTKSRLISGPDGSMIDYAFDIYMPKTDVVIPDFTADYVLNGNETGKVKRARNNQLNSRLWV